MNGKQICQKLEYMATEEATLEQLQASAIESLLIEDTNRLEIAVIKD